MTIQNKLKGTGVAIVTPFRKDSSIDFLSPDSSSIVSLNNDLSGLTNLITGALTYEGTEFGLLGKDVKLWFD